MFMKVHSVFTKVHSRGTVLRARRLRLPTHRPAGRCVRAAFDPCCILELSPSLRKPVVSL